MDVPAPLSPEESCGRPVWEDAGTDRCVWHAEKRNKPVSRLAATDADGTLIGGYAPATTLREVEFPAEATLLGASLARADLRRTTLSNADLRGADLSGADLIEADLAGAFLRHADLSGATLSTADLTDADLADADLSEAALGGAALREAGLHAADPGPTRSLAVRGSPALGVRLRRELPPGPHRLRADRSGVLAAVHDDGDSGNARGNGRDSHPVLATPVLAWETLYHSVLLFFTGSLVFAPTSVPGQMLITVEASTGPILLALLAFVLGRRAAR